MISADFLNINEGWIGLYHDHIKERAGGSQDKIDKEYDIDIITFSHFVPRRDLIPSSTFLLHKTLPMVAGEDFFSCV